MKNIAYVYMSAWISTGIAVILALYLTKSPICLWAFVLPAGLCLETNFNSSKTEILKDKK